MTYTSVKPFNACENMGSMPNSRNIALIVTTWNILNYQIPHSMCEVSVSWDLRSFYHQFIKNYSNIVMPLMELTQKNNSFTWSSSAAKAFDNLKTTFTYDPILIHAGLEKPFIIEADASYFAQGSILSQNGDDGKLQFKRSNVTAQCAIGVTLLQPAYFVVVLGHLLLPLVLSLYPLWCHYSQIFFTLPLVISALLYIRPTHPK